MGVSDKSELVACLYERMLVKWQIRALNRIRLKHHDVQCLWEQAEKIRTQLQEPFIPPRCRKEGKRFIEHSFKTDRENNKKRLECEYKGVMTRFRELFLDASRITWKMPEHLLWLEHCESEIARLKKLVTTPIEVEAADVGLYLCPDAVVGNQIELYFFKGKQETVGIAKIPLDQLLEKLEFGKKLKMWGLMNVVEIWRCNVRKEEAEVCKIVSKPELEKLKEDLLNANC